MRRNAVARALPERLLLPEEVAEMCRVSPKTVTRWALRGRLEHVRTPGGQVRIRESVARALVQFHGEGGGVRTWLAIGVTIADLAWAWEARARVLEKVFNCYRQGGRPDQALLDDMVHTRRTVREVLARRSSEPPP